MGTTDNEKITYYTKVPNWLFEELYQAGMSGTCHDVFLYIYRMTAGYNKNSDRLSLSTIANAIGCNKRSVIRSLQWLQENGWIKISKKKSKCTFYEINTITLLRGSDKNVTRGSDKNVINQVTKMSQYPLKGKDKPLSSGCLEAPLSGENKIKTYDELMMEEDDE